MDRVIEKKQSPYKKWGTLAFVAVLVVFAASQLMAGSGEQRYQVDRNSLNIVTVKSGRFDDYIPLRGIVEPKQTVFLDAVLGGQVEQVYVEEGAEVTQGQPLLKLRNATLELDIISREAQVTEQLNNLSNTRILMSQDKLTLKREVIDNRYRIKDLSRQIRKLEKLANKDYAAKDRLEALQDELVYYKQRLELSLERQEQNDKLFTAQSEQLEQNATHLNRNLTLARKNIDNLELKAPIDGYLTALNAEVGEFVSSGVRLGQIDAVNQFKVTAAIDEFYINRVNLGQFSQYELDGKVYRLKVAKIYPQVNNGQFEVDLTFEGEAPNNIRRGQSMQLKYYLGNSNEVVLLKRGSFYNQSGGNWVFVVDQEGAKAVKRTVRLGRKNPNYFEVLEGLNERDRVIISNYDGFENIDKLVLQ